LQVANQFAQGFALLRRAGVLWVPGCVQPAYIANAYTVSVVVHHVRAYLFYWSACVYAAVSVDNIVVAYTPKAARFVPAVYIGYRVVAALFGRATVYDNVVYLSHNV
jgi:hypothetical protein